MLRCGPFDRPAARIVGRDQSTPVAGLQVGSSGRCREAMPPTRGIADPLSTSPDRPSLNQHLGPDGDEGYPRSCREDRSYRSSIAAKHGDVMADDG